MQWRLQLGMGSDTGKENVPSSDTHVVSGGLLVALITFSRSIFFFSASFFLFCFSSLQNPKCGFCSVQVAQEKLKGNPKLQPAWSLKPLAHLSLLSRLSSSAFLFLSSRKSFLLSSISAHLFVNFLYFFSLFNFWNWKKTTTTNDNNQAKIKQIVMIIDNSVEKLPVPFPTPCHICVSATSTYPPSCSDKERSKNYIEPDVDPKKGTTQNINLSPTRLAGPSCRLVCTGRACPLLWRHASAFSPCSRNRARHCRRHSPKTCCIWKRALPFRKVHPQGVPWCCSLVRVSQISNWPNTTPCSDKILKGCVIPNQATQNFRTHWNCMGAQETQRQQHHLSATNTALFFSWKINESTPEVNHDALAGVFALIHVSWTFFLLARVFWKFLVSRIPHLFIVFHSPPEIGVVSLRFNTTLLFLCQMRTNAGTFFGQLGVVPADVCLGIGFLGLKHVSLCARAFGESHTRTHRPRAHTHMHAHAHTHNGKRSIYLWAMVSLLLVAGWWWLSSWWSVQWLFFRSQPLFLW